MDWLGDTIINLWGFTFSCWDWCMDTIQTVLTQSPVSIGGGTAWSAVSSIYSGVLGTGYALLTLFFFVGIFKTVGSLTDLRMSYPFSFSLPASLSRNSTASS